MESGLTENGFSTFLVLMEAEKGYQYSDDRNPKIGFIEILIEWSGWF